MKVLVTGGTGFVGKNLKKEYSNWIYVSSKDFDLTSREQCLAMYEEVKPDAVLHLAGKVGGIKENTNNQADFYDINTMINTNVVSQAHKAGIKRLLASLSTCAFPNVVARYPFSEEDLLKGPPAPTNLSYGYTKRSLYIQIKSYREQYGVNYSCFCPSNIYGSYDNFDSESSHFVPSMIKRFYECNDGDVLEFWGDGKALRQQLYIGDLIKALPLLLENHNTDLPLIISPSENLSIDSMIKKCLKKVNKSVIIEYNNKLKGQHRKDGSNKKFIDLVGEFNFTTFERGIEKTYEWYKNEREK